MDVTAWIRPRREWGRLVVLSNRGDRSRHWTRRAARRRVREIMRGGS